MAEREKTIWLINHYAADPRGSGGTRHYSLARYAARGGWKILLIAASVEHLTGRQRLGAGEKYRLEEISGVSFFWVRTAGYRGNGFRRVKNMLEFSWRLLWRRTTAELPAPDLVIGSTVHPLAALAGARLARRHRVPFVLEIRDLWPETLIQMGRIDRRSLAAAALRWLERYLCNRASRIIVLFPRAGEYLAGIGIDRQKVVCIPNGVDLQTFPYRSPRLSGRFKVMYLGAHGQANGLEAIMRAASILRQDTTMRHVVFEFVGDGPLKEALADLARSLGCADAVSFAPPVSKAALPEVAAQADAFILNVRNLPLYEYGFSFNKLFDYLAAGRPIVFAGPDSDNPVAEAGAGLVVPSDDAPAMAEAVKALVAMRHEERTALGLRGRRFVEGRYDYSALADRFSKALLSLTSAQWHRNRNDS